MEQDLAKDINMNEKKSEDAKDVSGDDDDEDQKM